MKFNRTILCALALACASIPSSLLAADMPVPEVQPLDMAAPAYDWSGGYFGGQIGYGWSQADVGTISFFDDPTLPATGTLPGFGFNGDGVIGGIETGINWQAGNMLFGIEGDLSAANINGSYTDTVNNFTVDSSLKWLSSARLRIGLPVDKFLFFATAGIAVGGVEATLHDTYGLVVLNTSDSSTNVGWTAGAGVAAAIDNHWSIKAEYLYTDLGSKQYNFAEDPSGVVGWPLISADVKTTASVVRFAIDYKF